MTIKPYLIVPNLIEQPTWGGDYIADLKNLQDDQIVDLKIGQSYELYQNTNLSSKKSTAKDPSIELADPKDPTQTQQSFQNDQIININQLIQIDPKKVLGTKAQKLHGNQIGTLIKLTQAKGNSYQLHVKKPVGNWLPKPESWYYFEPGLVTLGLNLKTKLKDYQKACQLIDQEARIISNKITQQKLSVEAGEEQLQKLIKKLDPSQYVNTLSVAKGSAIDLSACGIHHSWEEDPNTNPHGNIVYEVQQNVYDPVSTIRSFDKGKIKNDGTIRELQIEDYFKHIDTSETANNPQTHFTAKKVLKHTSTHTIRQIFDTSNYKLQEITFTKPISNQYTTTTDSYHHLFVRRGCIQLLTQDQTWTITQGFSVFIPANTDTYTLKPFKSKHPKVLKTYL